MHVVDLGVLHVLLGNIYYELFLEMGGTRKSSDIACGELLALMSWAAKQCGVAPPVNKITLAMLKKSGKPPKLKLKAAEGRHLVPLTLKILKLFPMNSDHASSRFHCLDHMNSIYLEMEPSTWNDVTSPAVISKLGRQFCILYSQICVDLHDQGLNEWYGRWRVLPKHHMFCHVVDDVHGNPRISWCYMDEHEIGVAAKSAGSLHPHTLPKIVMEKYRFLNFED
jgi:hypothetical protein